MTDDEIDAFFRNNYNTPLEPANQQRFQNWATAVNQVIGINPADLYDYDMQGFWLNGGHATPIQEGMHFPDTYKKPSHETFSNESIYHDTLAPNGGRWMGGTWGGPNGDQFTPHPQQYRRK